ncbi:MAG TPA: hypothetical protein VNO82_01520 [Solirubrobacteraceae bacterium]|nr:hypothetical protein [Solirubrobacteraceae bacterium]
MSPAATYSFLPWLRQGLANRVLTADMDPAVLIRAEVLVQLSLAGEKLDGGTLTEPINRKVALYGPGDLTGIERRAIVRAEPRDWITDYEPNYLPHIEFYDEDFPWRYTPAAPDMSTGRLRPWIALVVLDEQEFDEGTDVRDKPLPYVELPDPGVLPPPEQLWAWAHVHVNRNLAANDAELVSTDMPAVLARFDAVLAENPDLAYSRVVSQRKLAENRPYHAFLMPVFESGRLAGLGLDPADAPHATFSAWKDYPGRAANQGSRFPYYHRWFFRTGTTGDFESLVRLLRPRFVDKRVGTRDIDVRVPGSNVPGISDSDLGGVLKLGGALRVPRKNFTEEELEVVERYENWFEPYPHDFQRALATFVNLADDYGEHTAEDANAATGLGADVEDDLDPLITPPIYGRWHALTRRLLAERNGDPVTPLRNWVHELNLDPRHRVAAGFGTRVVQQEQERYMDAAWEQIGRVIEANRRIRLAQLGKRVSASWHERHVEALVTASPEKALAVTAPVAARVLSGDVTVRHRLAGSRVVPAMLSPPLRRVLRPEGRLVRSTAFTASVRTDNVLERVNALEASAAPPKTAPPAVVTAGELAESALPRGVPALVVGLLRRRLWWVVLLAALAVVTVVLLVAGILAAVIVAAAIVALAIALRPLVVRWTQAIDASDAIGEEERTPAAIDALPGNPVFTIADPRPGARPVPSGADSAQAARFKRGLRDTYGMLAASAVAGAVPTPVRLDLPVLAADLVTAIDPAVTIPKRLRFGIELPGRVTAEIGEELVEAMAYPEFDTPMYEPLKNISAELFLPNINLVEQNSITLLESNQDFIESYMVGLNHEFARELLWREYPTDQRGSYFRQFWDVRGVYDPRQPDAETLKEKLRDIPPLHKWLKASLLGEHDNREEPGEEEEELVLVIRGELLKRYPTAVIYAHRGCWPRTGPETDRHPCERSGAIDNTVERRLAPLTPEEEQNPPHAKVRTPLYEAKVDPDIYFFGFDLTAEEAIGGTGEPGDEDPGWFFVIKERPGEPRFGLDLNQQSEINVWNDLSWADVQPGPPGSFIEITSATPTIPLVVPTGPDAQEKLEQHQDDKNVSWRASMGAADLAYILYQAPVLVAVHASEMLPRS